MAQLICSRCGHVNPSTIDRCEHCYKKLDAERAETNNEFSKSISTHKKAGKKAPPPSMGTSSPSSSGKSIVPTGKGSVGSGSLSSPTSPSSLSFPGSSPKPLLPLPSHMHRYGTPPLEGLVRDLREMQLDRPLSAMDFAGDAILAIFEPKWALFSAVTKLTRREKHTAYAIQVEKASGIVQVALIQGGKLVIPPEIGEYVSIWGQEKKGITIVRSLFNHMTGAEI